MTHAKNWFPVKSITMLIEPLILWKASEVHFSGSIGVQGLDCHGPASFVLEAGPFSGSHNGLLVVSSSGKDEMVLSDRNKTLLLPMVMPNTRC